MAQAGNRPVYRPGDAVRVRADEHPGHHRTPGYLKGRHGVVQRHLENAPNPESLAYGGDGLPPVPVYEVRFAQADLWADYPGGPDDTVVAEILEHWLEADT